MLIDARLHLDKYGDLLDEALKQIETERIFTVAITTGWAHRADAFGGPDGCESDGQHIPFATTKAQREAAGDPRQSLEERYKNHEGYVKEVAKAAEKLEKQRFLLPADVKLATAGAISASVCFCNRNLWATAFTAAFVTDQAKISTMLSRLSAREQG